jgi:hypothetical protein
VLAPEFEPWWVPSHWTVLPFISHLEQADINGDKKIKKERILYIKMIIET